MIKILLNEKKILLAEDHQSVCEFFRTKNAHIVFSLNPEKARDLVDMLLISESNFLIVVGDEQINLEIFKKAFPYVRAGGGVVFNAKNQVLFIFRRKKWDLPKGKLDEGEDIKECALREVREETGIKYVEVVRYITDTYHLYIENKMMLKKTTWYLMRSNDMRLRPQFAEGITKALWISKNSIGYQLSRSYESVSDLFEILRRRN